MVSVFPSVELDQPDLGPLLQEFPEETRTRILEVVQDTHLKNSAKVRSWQPNLEANFKTSYQVSAEVINRVAENLHIYGKFMRALDKWHQSILCEVVISPSKHLKGKSGKVGLLRKPLKSKADNHKGGNKKNILISSSITMLYR